MYCLLLLGSVSGGGQWTRAPPAPPPGSVSGVVGSGVSLGVTGVSASRGRRPTQRHSAASSAMQMPHAGISAAAVQALANGWNLPGALTQAQTQQVLRLAQAQVAQAQAAARYNNAAIAAAAVASMPQHRSSHGRTVQVNIHTYT
ncbi:uncharacterized protein LOC123658930 [Melitaea cinxia]|uniref:uncharacterized protein LOC123658930 n=1 Tax=Melitaea cinxia TaxID=113334 RepID=UPI001E273871|nr:uncharacterized protein LOC123658930 [Melitaea cinxia]